MQGPSRKGIAASAITVATAVNALVAVAAAATVTIAAAVTAELTGMRATLQMQGPSRKGTA